MINIQQQLQRQLIKEETASKVQDYVYAERVCVIDLLFTFATSSLKEECKRRAIAIDDLTALCSVQEGRRTRVGHEPRFSPESKCDDTLLTKTRARIFSESLPVRCTPTQCIFCLSDEELLELMRLKSFHSRGALKKHIHRKHLKHHPKGMPIECPFPKCEVTLSHTEHLQSHAEIVHETPT